MCALNRGSQGAVVAYVGTVKTASGANRAADCVAVAAGSGHASVTTTQIYTLVTVGALREVWAGAHPRAR
jgi:site-specific recombinase XerC